MWGLWILSNFIRACSRFEEQRFKKSLLHDEVFIMNSGNREKQQKNTVLHAKKSSMANKARECVTIAKRKNVGIGQRQQSVTQRLPYIMKRLQFFPSSSIETLRHSAFLEVFICRISVGITEPSILEHFKPSLSTFVFDIRDRLPTRSGDGASYRESKFAQFYMDVL